jgi:hypothetical protein
VAYCHFWQAKLSDNKQISFPDKLCEAVAGITDKFSFAYIQEAFVAALLAIARDEKPEAERIDEADEWVDVGVVDEKEDPELEKLVLWRAIKKQVAILREGLGDDADEESVGTVRGLKG